MMLQEVESVKGSLGEAREALQEEGKRREQALEASSRHIQETAVAAEEQLKQHQAKLTERLDHLASLEGMVLDLTDKERATREIEMAEIVRAIYDFSRKFAAIPSELSVLEERLNKAVADSAESAVKA